MCVARVKLGLLLLRTSGGRSVEPGIDAADRQAVSGNALLRLAEDDGGVTAARLSRQWEARAAVDAPDGIAGHHRAQASRDDDTRTSDLSLPVTQHSNRAAESGVVCRYYLCADAAWVSV